MRLKTRFSLIGIGIIVFVFITPFLVFYARGFLYDFKTGSIVKTGALVLATKPEKVKIFLNDKLYKKLSPTTIRFLMPNDYNIRLEREGYQSYTKRLSVRAQFVTWVNKDREYVNLFLKQPRLIKTIPFQSVWVSKDLTQAAIIQDGHLLGLNFNNAQTNDFGPATAAWMSIFNNNSAAFRGLASTIDLIKEIDWNTPEALLLNNATKIESNGNYLLFLNNSNLYSMGSGKTKLIAFAVSDFTLDETQVWFVEKDEIKSFNLRSNVSQKLIDKLAPAKTYKLTSGPGRIFLNLDEHLYAITDKLEKIYDPVTSVFWDMDSEQLVLSNNKEFSLFNPVTQTTTVILRSTTDVFTPKYNPISGYFLFGNEQKIKTIEVDGRDHRNVYNLLPLENTFTVSRDAKLLYSFSDSEIKVYEIY